MMIILMLSIIEITLNYTLKWEYNYDDDDDDDNDRNIISIIVLTHSPRVDILLRCPWNQLRKIFYS